MTKLILTLLITSISFTPVFADTMTLEDQESYIEDLAKYLRRDAWRSGHEEVSSYHVKATKEFLDDFVKSESNGRYESALDSDEIADLYRCFYRQQCELYYVGVSSEYWGGYGETGNFILLNVTKENHRRISHTVYAE